MWIKKQSLHGPPKKSVKNERFGMTKAFGK